MPGADRSSLIDAQFHIHNAYVLAGGPGAGKTTVLSELAQRGYATWGDAARAIIARRKAAGLSPRPAPEAFARAMIDDAIGNLEQAGNQTEPVFCDYGLCTAVAAWAAANPNNREEAERLVDLYRYNPKVFLFPPWPAIYQQDAERDHPWEHAVRVYEETGPIWERCGYKLIEVPPATPPERADFILEHVEG